MSNKLQAGTDLYNKENAENVILSVDRHEHETFSVGNTQSEAVKVEINNINNSPNPQLDLDNLTISQNTEILDKEGAKDDVTVTVIMKDMNSNPSFLRKDVKSNPKSFNGGIIPMRSLSLVLFVHQQLETKSKRSRQIDKFHQ